MKILPIQIHRFLVKKSLRGRGAFTLVEFLLAFSIFSIIALTLYTVYSNGILVHQASQRAQQLSSDIRWSLETLAQDLENTVPYTAGQEASPTFEWKADRLSFLIPTDNGLKVVRYFLEMPEQTRIYKIIVNKATKKNKAITVGLDQRALPRSYLVREEIPLAEFLSGGNKGGSSRGAALRSEVLSTNVQSGTLGFSFAYKDAKNNVPEIIWKDEWVNPKQPAGVRVKIVFIDPEDPTQPVPVQKNIFIPTGTWGEE